MYVGDDPKYDLFKNDNLDHFTKAVNEISNFNQYKSAVINYCELDCISLHSVLCSFGKLVQDKFNSNILTFPTILSLSFFIFKELFLQPK